ncbi:Cytochrome P450 E-class group I protein [Dioscorea alata]|uniref:Cytochrome P450 E-class group I protein n=1 Tax=Dioscorea alata TaxID=55571 RepID=A0ACB7UUI0_DIOAL|nr:Cytochrome P450 E-class group I protein [Dioscorea alata]
MELWLFILITISFILTLILLLFKPSITINNHEINNNNKKLPPGPLRIPVIGSLVWLRRTVANIEPVLRDLHSKHGPIFTIHIGSRPFIFVFDRSLAHKLLIEHGSIFSDRPNPPLALRFLSMNQHNISGSPYGPLWRLLRRNLISEILHPNRVKLFSHGRDWVLRLLITKLKLESESSPSSGVVTAMDSFSFAMFCLLVLMCFGEKLDEKAIKEIGFAQRDLLLYTSKLSVFSFAPGLTKYLFRHRWSTALEKRRRQKEIFTPLIRARKEHKIKHLGRHGNEDDDNDQERFVYSYVDSLLDLKIQEDGGRELSDDELVVLCSEFLNAGTDTTSTALQWIMANVVKYPEVQKKVMEEIESVVGVKSGEMIKEEDLQRMPYVKAVVMEGLRRHPPAHLVLSHTSTEEFTVEGYVIPKGALINFGVAEMGWDDKVWEKPMEFRPERFLSQGVDVTGSREIKMMPFGVGRRICPGWGLAVLHLEYFVANLIKEFEWKEVEGEEVDFTEKPQFTVVMKHPLRAHIIPRC